MISARFVSAVSFPQFHFRNFVSFPQFHFRTFRFRTFISAVVILQFVDSCMESSAAETAENRKVEVIPDFFTDWPSASSFFFFFMIWGKGLTKLEGAD